MVYIVSTLLVLLSYIQVGAYTLTLDLRLLPTFLGWTFFGRGQSLENCYVERYSRYTYTEDGGSYESRMITDVLPELILFYKERTCFAFVTPRTCTWNRRRPLWRTL